MNEIFISKELANHIIITAASAQIQVYAGNLDIHSFHFNLQQLLKFLSLKRCWVHSSHIICMQHYSVATQWFKIEQCQHLHGLSHQKGRMLYTDNFYTSLEVIKHAYETNVMLMVGTYKLSKKKDCPFAIISGGEMKNVEHGWQLIVSISLFHIWGTRTTIDQ